MDTGEPDTRLCWVYARLWTGLFEHGRARADTANEMSDMDEAGGEALVLRGMYDLVVGESLSIISKLDLRTSTLAVDDESKSGAVIDINPPIDWITVV